MYGFLTIVALVVLVFFFLIKFAETKKLRPSGKSVVITGCDSGVGLSLAITAHKLGFHVVATCLDTYGYGANLMREKYPDILIAQMDVTKPPDIENVLKIVRDHLQQTETCLWALINNAGILVYGHFDWQLESQVLMQVQVNLIGVLQVTKAFQPLIRQAKGKPFVGVLKAQSKCNYLKLPDFSGRIINITSANGHWCLPGLSVYCGTKHAVEGFSNSLRMEMIPWNVKVILVNPGNLPGSTRIMAAQAQYAEAMRKNFSHEDNQLYGDYFELFQKHLETNFSAANLNQGALNDPGLDKVVESSLLLENPHHYYQNISLGFRIFILATKLVPTYYADRMMLRMWGSTVGYKLI